MKIKILILSIFCIFQFKGPFCSSQIIQRDLQSCDTGEVYINGNCVENDIDDSQMTSNVTIFRNVGMILKWNFPDNDSINFMMEIQQSSWMAVGIGTSMNDGDVFVVQINDDETIDLSDRHMVGHQPPQIDDVNDLNLLGYSVSDSKTKVKFSRALNTGDTQDKVLVKNETFSFLAAYTSQDKIQQHSSWGILPDIGIIIALHFKTWKWYQWAHGFIFFIVDILTVVFVLIKIYKNDDVNNGIAQYQNIINLKGINHPGGNYIFKQILGREIDRFYFGGYNLEEDKRLSHVHSAKAELFAIKKSLELVNNNFEGKNLEKMPEYSQELNLCIKRYEPKGKTLSSIIYQNTGKILYIQGPQGLGLSLDNIGKGKVMIIVGGTGILPFLDFFNMLLQKVIYEIGLKLKGKDFADEKIDVHKIGLSQNLNGIEVQKLLFN
ncbi:hypothetical protein PPERSA_11490 [Pseudocohnilembus persalinus]|uniref:DOMON domain-containing protein n=1 Tax=Pseudocohnilembus persalinus TaxID=266149 RepID=A0A0V0QXM3_PSEPJ|nr:hypothetical protein PPERSA_11490 [Pseudocohnilembus persalinus]|eukprot:KRX06845.1 hypothetical protein PPERSA_11490 [Pseudocohnilembus persalinus]